MRAFWVSLIVAGAVAGTAGCRTDSTSPTAAQIQPDTAAADKPVAPTPAEIADNRPLLVCFGDSLTAGHGAETGASYPDFLQKALDDDGFHYRVVNEGISGNTTKDGVDRLAQIIAIKPDVVILEFGGNDGLRGLKVDTMKDNLGTMIAGLKKGGAKVVLAGITLPPDYGPDYVSSFTAMYPALGHKHNVPVLPFILKNVYGIPGMMQADNIHATEKGNEIVAGNVKPLVEPLLKK